MGPKRDQTGRIRPGADRPVIKGKFLFIGDEKFLVKGVSYGAFRPRGAAKEEYWDHPRIDSDFRQMAANGINTVRIPHTMPPVSLLDAADRHGLKVMVGLSAEQYIGYLIDTGKKRPPILEIVRGKVASVTGHPALLCYAIGNEIPAPVARWLGARRIERYVRGIYDAIKASDPEGLVTYVNYPSTEYLDLPFLDLVSFNVYLESEDRLKAYLARLQSRAGDRPLLMSEVGLDALRNGEAKQADVLRWQVADSFAAGCAGVVLFSWTDEWHRAGEEVGDWAFGLTDRMRNPKPALAAVREVFAELPFPPTIAWPFVSVVVCSHNGSRTLEECLAAVTRLSYPKFEVVLVNDGSTDATPDIGAKYGCRVITTANRGLSAARNLGAEAARGEILAYLDDDAAPDPHWLHHLAHAFNTTTHAAIGGPNVLPAVHGLVEACVDASPGGPQHVLLTDDTAEHIPGCNFGVWKACLESVGGFDPAFRAAGDDVDFCWRLQARGWTIGFAPGAVVWHRRRRSIRSYLMQQAGYGRAESLLERKWPEKYNGFGHHTFQGRIYGVHNVHALFRRRSVYHGSGGFAPFQSLYERSTSVWGTLPLMPEWYLLIILLAGVSAIAGVWHPLWPAAALLAVAISLTMTHAAKEAWDVAFAGPRQSASRRAAARSLVALLHVLQPLARLSGRMEGGLTAWRRVGRSRFLFPWPRTTAVLSREWLDPAARLEDVVRRLRDQQNAVIRGGPFDRWDLEVLGGAFGSSRMLMAVEDHGAGTQYVRVRCWPRVRRFGGLLLIAAAVVVALTAAAAPWQVTGSFVLLFLWVCVHSVRQCGHTTGAIYSAAIDVASARDTAPGPSATPSDAPEVTSVE